MPQAIVRRCGHWNMTCALPRMSRIVDFRGNPGPSSGSTVARLYSSYSKERTCALSPRHWPCWSSFPSHTGRKPNHSRRPHRLRPHRRLNRAGKQFRGAAGPRRATPGRGRQYDVPSACPERSLWPSRRSGSLPRAPHRRQRRKADRAMNKNAVRFLAEAVLRATIHGRAQRFLAHHCRPQRRPEAQARPNAGVR